MSVAENKVVYLSYASQEPEAALRLCSGLRAAGVEVWFDQSESVELVPPYFTFGRTFS